MKIEEKLFIEKEITKFEVSKGVKVAFLAYSGSHLHGTNHENSDLDIVGFFIPSIESLILKKEIKDIELTPNQNIEIKLFNIYSLLEKLDSCDSIAVDMLFTMLQQEFIIKEEKKIIDFFRENIDLFFTKNYLGLVGFSLSQVKKYEIKSKRFNSISNILSFLESRITKYGEEFKIKELSKIDSEIFLKLDFIKEVKQDNRRFISVIEKKFEETNKLSDVLKKVISIEKEYGHRVRTNKDNIDYKALSHALRSIKEVIELRVSNRVKFPLESSQELLDLKLENKKNRSIPDLVKYIFQYQKDLKENKELIAEKIFIQDSLREELLKIAFSI